MNFHTQHSGQISGQVQNQAGTPLAGLQQQTGNFVLGQMQNPNVHRGVPNMDIDIVKARKYMQEVIFQFLMRSRQQSHEATSKKMADLATRLEEALFKSATTMEEYLNADTLKARLHVLISRPRNNLNQQFQHANSSPSIGTMIPTPGLQQPENPNLIADSSLDSFNPNNNFSTVSTAVHSGGLLQAGNQSSIVQSGSFSASNGSGKYQQSTGFSVNSARNNMVASVDTQRMIPTPGFDDSNANDVIHNFNNQSFMNVESFDNVGTFLSVEPANVSKPMQQNQHIGGQNRLSLHNLGGTLGGIRSTLQQKVYGSPYGSSSGMTGTNVSPLNGPGITEGYSTGAVYENSPKPMHHQFEQQQRLLMQGAGYGILAADASGSGNLYDPVTSVGSTMNNQSLNGKPMQSMPKTILSSTNNQLRVQSVQQVTTMKSQLIDQSNKMNFCSQYSVNERIVQDNKIPPFQQSPHQFQGQQLIQHQVHQNHQSQNQLLLKNDTLSRSQPLTIVSDVKLGFGTEPQMEGLQSQSYDALQISDMQIQFQQNSTEENSRATHLLSRSSAPLDVIASLTQTSGQMKPSLNSRPENDVGSLSGGTQLDATLRDQWCSRSREASLVSGGYQHDQKVLDEFHHRSTGQVATHRNNLSSKESMVAQSDTTKLVEPPCTSNRVGRSKNLNREQQFKNQQRWLLFLRHARHCPHPEGNCPESNCVTVQKLLKHRDHCDKSHCSYPHCSTTKVLIDHASSCHSASCPVCIPVSNYIHKALIHSDIGSRLPPLVNGSCKTHDTTEIAGKSAQHTSPVIAEALEDLQPSTKRIKVEKGSQSLVPESESSVTVIPTVIGPQLQGVQHFEKHNEPRIPMTSEITEAKHEVCGSLGQLNPKIDEVKKENLGLSNILKPEDNFIASDSRSKLGVEVVTKMKEMTQAKSEDISVPSESTLKSGKPEIKGVSMIELFTPEQVREHILGLRQWVGQSKAKAEKNQAMGYSMTENSCQLCAVEKLNFEPLPIYCTHCGARIKRNAMYYTTGTGETRHCFCIPCYNEARGDTMVVEGTTTHKARMEKKKNDEETEEAWVQCDKCEVWQHQICALFNSRRNDSGQAEYTCPNCYLKEVERGERMPLPQSAVLGAKDLPRTILSDHLEQRLFAKLKQERLDRSRFQGKSFDEVPGAESLVVRVVSSVDKKLEVKPRFLEIFQEENYPAEFHYKSKVVLLFQKIEGVEVCLFGMYVQEFGSECQQPNHRRVYLSYLDSVKYFRSEVRTVKGEALRTFVYHEILIGYLEYCKMRGFTSCYIWACPPLKGEDYILYCHPEIQKTPKSDKLREWYLSMLRKASKEGIVVELTNLYDHFFVSNGECKARVTAARLPYFDGDYWPGAAEDMIFQLQHDEDNRKEHKKSTIKKAITKRALKASGQMDLSGNASKDLFLMHKLGETIYPMREDFIMVHLQHACSHCCTLMVSGHRWICKQCKKFELCDKCYDAEQKREDRERHPINQKDKHALYPVEIVGVPDCTKDKDEILESEFFDTRHAFLSLCQGNHYQYDTLRRAKHSSMMVLYHLHNPTAPAFVTTCYICSHDIESGQGWRCETCPEYDVCNACYQKDGAVNHPHKLTNNPSSDRDAQNKEAKQLRVLQLKKMLQLLVHASQCLSPHCQYPNCRKVKGLFRHGIRCKQRASGGCVLCKKMWHLLQLHARACKESQCSVPRCRDLRGHIKRLQQQAESRRRAAVNEMMRQRAAEVADS